MNANFNRHSIAAFVTGTLLAMYGVAFLIGGLGPYLA